MISEKIKDNKINAEARLSQVIIEQEKYDIANILSNPSLVNYNMLRDCEILSNEIVQIFVDRIYIAPLSNELCIMFNDMERYEDIQRLIKDCISFV
jgi:hypothetical protein